MTTTLENIEAEARRLHERDCLPEEVDCNIYDYENASACLKRNSDYKDRTVIKELAEDIESMRIDLESRTLTIEDALKELDSSEMNYLKYCRGQLQACVVEMFARLGLNERFKIDPGKL